jgi:hypothetical protein
MLDHESEVFLFLYYLLLQQQTRVFPVHITRRSGNNLRHFLSFRHFSLYPEARKNYEVTTDGPVVCRG